MVVSCRVKGYNSKGGENIKFHNIPKGDVGEAWISFLTKYNPLFKPTKTTKVCELHFDPSLYEITPTSVFKTKKLKENAVPSIYNTDNEIVTLTLSDLDSESSDPCIPETKISNLQEFAEPVERQLNFVESSPDKQNTNLKRKCFMGDFKEPSDINSPNSRLKYWIASQSTVSNQKKRIKYLYKQNLDLKKRIKTLDDLVDHLKNDKKVISDNCFTVLKESLSSSQHEMVMKQLHQISATTVSPELRSFALTLHFYSPTSYNYVRKTFNKCLPHPSTIRKWYSVIDGSPGITAESMNAIKMKVKEMKMY
ncbi:THAP domain-containing protein 1-like [Acyrthosiphon pisum]|uniref:THAP-type domain-containing protein n=1 Tax=Acyrthosiphon pisum TaxID=7029 RepID=A0A8R1WYN4_ACYPI|nr:THAP domain-containing protein 1-like [Acyrthosiphon pisum]|eukprot:XP_008179512.1 PREDICTED: THAP domain-containing protein 1-like [Acyrthosiphon pisum]